MDCTHCGKLIWEDSRYCNRCGMPQDKPAKDRVRKIVVGGLDETTNGNWCLRTLDEDVFPSFIQAFGERYPELARYLLHEVTQPEHTLSFPVLLKWMSEHPKEVAQTRKYAREYLADQGFYRQEIPEGGTAFEKTLVTTRTEPPAPEDELLRCAAFLRDQDLLTQKEYQTVTARIGARFRPEACQEP